MVLDSSGLSNYNDRGPARLEQSETTISTLTLNFESVRAAMQQLDHRVTELERLQTDPASSSSNQHTTIELQLHQEIQQLAHKL